MPTHASMQLASALLGTAVLNHRQEALGKISDLLVDLTAQKPAFAILAAGGMSNEKQTFAVPLRSLSPAPQAKYLLDANRTMFQQTPPFTEKAWLATST